MVVEREGGRFLLSINYPSRLILVGGEPFPIHFSLQLGESGELTFFKLQASHLASFAPSDSKQDGPLQQAEFNGYK